MENNNTLDASQIALQVQKLLEKSTTDAKFRQELITDSRAALEAVGVSMDADFIFVEQQAGEYFLPIPNNPSQAMSDEDTDISAAKGEPTVASLEAGIEKGIYTATFDPERANYINYVQDDGQIVAHLRIYDV